MFIRWLKSEPGLTENGYLARPMSAARHALNRGDSMLLLVQPTCQGRLVAVLGCLLLRGCFSISLYEFQHIA